MAKEIEIRLNTKEIDNLVRYLQKYSAEIEKKTKELCEAIANEGYKVALVEFATAQYDDNQSENDVVVYVEHTDNGLAIVASGYAVCFIEFGAGVYYNSGQSYPGERPDGVSEIGEYGMGLGNFPSWYFMGSDGVLHKTHGTPMSMPMQKALIQIQNNVVRIAKEIFGD